MYNATLKYQITDWMDISGRAKVDNTTNRYTFKKYATTDAIWASENGGYQDEQSTYQSFYGDVMLNINKTWNDWSLSANIGGSINDQRYQMIGHAGNLRDANLFAVHNLDYTTKYKPNNGTKPLLAAAIRKVPSSSSGKPSGKLTWVIPHFLSIRITPLA